MNEGLTLSTEREAVVLRQLTLDDAEAYFNLIDTNREHLSQFGDDTSEKYPDLFSVEASMLDPKKSLQIRMGIWDGETFVGTVNLRPDSSEETAELGYLLGENFQGNGYATLAASALAAYGKEKFGQVFAEVAVEEAENGTKVNEKSARVLERAGFRLTSKKVGSLVFTL